MARRKMDKLSREVAMAREAGMSYGKWKAMQPVVAPTPKRVGRAVVCAYCGKEFIQYTKNQRKYCDDLCKGRAANEAEKQRRREKAG